MKIPPFKELNPPDSLGYWTNKKTGEKYGGQYISPLLIPNLKKVEAGFKKAMKNKKFLSDLEEQLINHIGIVTPILRSKELEDIAGGEKKIGKIFLKRTDLHHDSSHKPVSAFSSVYFAKHILKAKKIITETGASMNARAVASACAKLSLDCEVHIGALDAEKVSLNKDITELYGAKIIECHDSTKTLLPAMAAALRSWQSDPSAMYVVGSCCGPHPYPLMVRTFASIIGRIAKKQIRDLTGKLPSTVFAVCGGGSNLSAISYPYYNEKRVDIFGIESAETEASGLDFSGTGPEICYMASTGKIKFRATNDKEAQETFLMMCRKTGILPAIEACYVIHAALKEIKKRKNPRENHLIHLCGSGESNVGRMLRYKRDNE